MKAGDIALTILPQADGTGKPRPAVLLCQLPPFGDWLACGVSTQLQQRAIGFDEVIQASDPDFRISGLKAASLIRLGFLAAFPAHDFLGVIGSISRQRHSRLLRRLGQHLILAADKATS